MAATLAATSLALAACGFGASEGNGTAAVGASSPGNSATRVSGKPTPAAPQPVSITLSAAGDLLVHVKVRNNAAEFARTKGKSGYDFSPMFGEIKPLISSADVAICHLETPLSRDNTGLSRPGVLIFNTPHELATAIKGAGYDGCDFASNHTWDGGLDGLKRTQQIMESAGLQYAGPQADPADPESVAWYEAKGLKIAQLAYSYTILNNFGPNTETPADAPWIKGAMWPSVKAAGIRAAAQKARAAGADIVVVSLHWGQEYVTKPTEDQTSLAQALLGSPDVDLILGTHVHVVQPCQTINGKYVFYGMGNQLSNQGPSEDRTLRPDTQDGMIASVTFTKGADGTVTQKATYQPTWVDLDNGHIIDLVTKKSNPASWTRTTKSVGLLGDKCSATPTGG